MSERFRAAAMLSGCVAIFCGCDASERDEPRACFPVPELGATALPDQRPERLVDDTARRRAVSEADAGSEAKRPGTKLQGRELQGTRQQGVRQQGKRQQGKRQQATGLGLSELNGARLEIADTGVSVRLGDGTLVAPGFADTDALRGTTLTVTARDGMRFGIEVSSVHDDEGTERVALSIDGVPVCDPGDEGMFVEGRWSEDGAHHATPGELTYSCMSGVIAKCATWGYAPWIVGAALHQTCTRLARADYCGDGNSWTLDGTTIDVYDNVGVLEPVPDPGFSFEAAWSTDGALCVSQTRYLVVDADGADVQPTCFAALPQCTSLAEAEALGAVLANDSTHVPIDACE